MGAITKHYSAAESGVRAVQAGADVVLFSHTEERQKEAFKAMVAAARSGELPEDRIDAGVQRVTAFKERYAREVNPDTGVVRRPVHLAITQKAARAGIVLFKASDLLPLGNAKAGLVEFSPNLDVQAMDPTGLSSISEIFRRKLPALRSVVLNPQSPESDGLGRASQLAQECEVMLVATRNAHLLPAQLRAARRLLEEHARTVLLCLRNPYDVQLLSASAVLCSCGDSRPSLEALVDAVLGEFTPNGRLPVTL
jgi:beta-N-acetylhexosaminidase